MSIAQEIAQANREHLHPSDPLENAVDQIFEIRNDLTDSRREWFSERHANEGNCEEIRSNFHKPMPRRRTKAETDRVRFDVNLWSTVLVGDGNGDDVQRKVAAELRAMSAFLVEQAEAIERQVADDRERRATWPRITKAEAAVE